MNKIIVLIMGVLLFSSVALAAIPSINITAPANNSQFFSTDIYISTLTVNITGFIVDSDGGNMNVTVYNYKYGVPMTDRYPWATFCGACDDSEEFIYHAGVAGDSTITIYNKSDESVVSSFECTKLYLENTCTDVVVHNRRLYVHSWWTGGAPRRHTVSAYTLNGTYLHRLTGNALFNNVYIDERIVLDPVEKRWRVGDKYYDFLGTTESGAGSLFIGTQQVRKIATVDNVATGAVKVSVNLSQGYTNITMLVADSSNGNRSNSSQVMSYHSDNSKKLIDLNATKINEIIRDGCTCTNCSITSGMCNLPITFYSSAAESLQVNISLDNLSFGVDNCSTYNYSILNFTYFDQISDAAITLTNGYDLTFTADGGFSQELSGEFTGQTSDAFCSRVNSTDHGFNYTITGQLTLSKTGYGTQIYEIPSESAFDGVVTPTTQQEIFLIQLNESTTVKFNWRDETYAGISGSMLIYECIGDGSQRLVQSIPIIDGIANANIELVNTPYSYQVQTGGELFSDTTSYSKCHVESQTEVTYFVQTTETDTDIVVGLVAVNCNTTRTGNDTVKVEWEDNELSSETITGCIYADRFEGGWTQIYVNCTTTANSIERTIPNTGYNYLARGKIFQGGLAKECGEPVSFNFAATPNDNFGSAGIIFVAFLVLALGLAFAGEDEKFLMGAGIAFVIAWFFGMLAFDWVTISLIMVFIGIIVAIGRSVSK